MGGLGENVLQAQASPTAVSFTRELNNFKKIQYLPALGCSLSAIRKVDLSFLSPSKFYYLPCHLIKV